MKKLAPCDCPDMATAKLLNEQGISVGNTGILVEPGRVILKIDQAEIRMPMSIFKQIATWYLEEQNISGEIPF
jgi:hypothetical protein